MSSYGISGNKYRGTNLTSPRHEKPTDTKAETKKQEKPNYFSRSSSTDAMDGESVANFNRSEEKSIKDRLPTPRDGKK